MIINKKGKNKGQVSNSFRSAWPVKVCKRFADEYLTESLLNFYKEQSQHGKIYVSELMYGLIELKGVLKTARRENRLIKAKRVLEWEDGNFQI